jgi:DNA repair exonuclease SbcCD ATPase subunit
MMALFANDQSIERMARELADARSKLEALRSKQVASEQAHGVAVTRRRVLLLFDHQVDEGKATKADREVREVEDHLSALAGAIAEQETTVAELTARLAEAKRAEVEDKAREAEAHAVALERALGNLKPVMIEFADVCRAAGAVISEPMGMGRTLTDILRHVEGDTAYYTELLRQRAKVLRQLPPAPVAPKVPQSFNT